MCKFGLYEVFKVHYSEIIGEENSYVYRTGLYLAASASAEFFADIALSPMEAAKVSNHLTITINMSLIIEPVRLNIIENCKNTCILLSIINYSKYIIIYSGPRMSLSVGRNSVHLQPMTLCFDSYLGIFFFFGLIFCNML